jgi:glycerol-3-phosphate dehydrogenase
MPDHIVVIGAGIQGAGVAQAAAAAGFKVTMLEKSSIGGATSSNSSKLIHGGLRYLESAQFGLVRECLLERQLLLKLAPELISLQRFYIPIFDHSKRRPWQIRLGLAAYSALSGFNRAGQYGEVPRVQWSHFDGLKQQQLRSVHYYYDAQTNDQLLTQAVVQSAQRLGAELLLGANVRTIDIHKHGCHIGFEHNGREQFLEAAAVVNCSGPWVNQLLAKTTPEQAPLNIELVQGSHLLIKNTGIKHYYYLETPCDHRAIFALPYLNKLLVGTTEVPYMGDPSNARTLALEEAYLIDSLRYYFPELPAQLEIQQRLCGLRVLPQALSKSPFGRHRETLYQRDHSTQPRLISVAGGKLTSYRLSALKVMEQLRPTLNHSKIIASTDKLLLTPNN